MRPNAQVAEFARKRVQQRFIRKKTGYLVQYALNRAKTTVLTLLFATSVVFVNRCAKSWLFRLRQTGLSGLIKKHASVVLFALVSALEIICFIMMNCLHRLSAVRAVCVPRAAPQEL